MFTSFYEWNPLLVAFLYKFVLDGLQSCGGVIKVFIEDDPDASPFWASMLTVADPIAFYICSFFIGQFFKFSRYLLIVGVAASIIFLASCYITIEISSGFTSYFVPLFAFLIIYGSFASMTGVTTLSIPAIYYSAVDSRTKRDKAMSFVLIGGLSGKIIVKIFMKYIINSVETFAIYYLVGAIFFIIPLLLLLSMPEPPITNNDKIKILKEDIPLNVFLYRLGFTCFASLALKVSNFIVGEYIIKYSKIAYFDYCSLNDITLILISVCDLGVFLVQIFILFIHCRLKVELSPRSKILMIFFGSIFYGISIFILCAYFNTPSIQTEWLLIII